jgi:hypothetical protein
VDKIETAQIIYAIDMVSVGVAEKHGVNPPDVVPQRLSSQIAGCIDQNGVIIIT